MEDLFRQLNGFVALPADARDALTRLFAPLSLPKAAYFARAGEPTRQIAFVRAGVLRAFYTSPAGVEYNKTFFTAGDFLGVYYALLLRKPSHLSVQALTAAELLVADFDAVQALYDSHPLIERFARRLAETYFIRKEQRELDLVTLDARARYEQFRRNYPQLEQQIPQYHIASHLGITPTQLSRIRARL